MITKRSLLLALLAAYLGFFAIQGTAQITIQQQMPGYSNTPAGTRPESQIPDSMHNQELMPVPEDFAKLKLAPGFLVSLVVLDDSDFSGNYRVDEDGDLTFPFLGDMPVAGRTASEVRTQIKEALQQQKILQDPQVNLNIVEYVAPEVTIAGEVISPGKYPLLAPRRLVDVIGLAGGLTMLAGNEVRITHASSNELPISVHYSKDTDAKTLDDTLVHSGDVVQVKRAGVVYVLGAVIRPGGYVMQEDGTLDVKEAIALANGPLYYGKDDIIVLHRNPDDTMVRVNLSYKKLTEGKIADVQLAPKDIVYLPLSPIKSFLNFNGSLLGSAASASIYAISVNH